MRIEKTARFLNVDLVVSGRFDRGPLMRAIGERVFALHERAVVDEFEALVIEVNSSTALDLAATLEQWARRGLRPHLPPVQGEG